MTRTRGVVLGFWLSSGEGEYAKAFEGAYYAQALELARQQKRIVG